MTILEVYFDDILLTGKDQYEIDELKQFLNSEFKIKDLGLANYFLGMEILHLPEGLIVTQRKFAMDLFSEHLDLPLRTTSTPMDPTLKLTMDSGELLPNPTICRY